MINIIIYTVVVIAVLICVSAGVRLSHIESLSPFMFYAHMVGLIMCVIVMWVLSNKYGYFNS